MFNHTALHGSSTTRACSQTAATRMMAIPRIFTAANNRTMRHTLFRRDLAGCRALRKTGPSATTITISSGSSSRSRSSHSSSSQLLTLTHPTSTTSSSSSQQQLAALTGSSSRSSSSSSSSSQPWALGVAAAAAVVVLALGAATAGPAHAEPVAQLAQAMSGLKIPGLVGDNQFTEGFVSGLLLIFFSEIGDKTFFIALLLALRQDRSAVFTGTFGALAIMTIISVALGQVFHQLDELLPASDIPLDDLLAVTLLLYFGINTLKGAADADAKAAEEKEEADEVVAGLSSSSAAAATATLVASTFSLVFAAEWGDKSFLATIALAAASDPLGVTVGAVTGHGLATGIAVAGGSLLSQYISERTAQYIGGSLFLVFAAATIFDIVTGAHGA